MNTAIDLTADVLIDMANGSLLSLAFVVCGIAAEYAAWHVGGWFWGIVLGDKP